MPENGAALIIDDDPSHLQIYGWILNTAGFDALPALVHGEKIEIPRNRPLNLVILDYQLRAKVTALEAAKLVNEF